MYGALLAFILGLLIRTKSHHPERTQHDSNTTTDKQQNNPSIPARVQVSFSEDDQEEHRTYQEKHYALQKSLQRAAWLTFWAVFIYAGITLAMWRATNKAANAAKESADITAKQFELSQRPLVSFYPTINRALSISPDGAQIGVEISYTNKGHSPAMKFWHNIEMLPTTVDAIAKREELCAQTKAQQAVNERMTDTLFPEDNFVQTYIVGVDKPAINFARSANHGYMLPVIVACVAYQPNFSDSVYTTGRIFDVFTVDPSKPGILLAVDVRETTIVPIDRLRLTAHFEGATNAR